MFTICTPRTYKQSPNFRMFSNFNTFQTCMIFIIAQNHTGWVITFKRTVFNIRSTATRQLRYPDGQFLRHL